MKNTKPSDGITASNYEPAMEFKKKYGLKQFSPSKFLEVANSLRPQGLTITDLNIIRAVNPKRYKDHGKQAMLPLVEAGLFTVLPEVTALGQEYMFTKLGYEALADLKALKDGYDAKVEAEAKAKADAKVKAKAKPVVKPVAIEPVKVEVTEPLNTSSDDNQDLRQIINQLVITVEKQSASMDAMTTELFRLGKLWS